MSLHGRHARLGLVLAAWIFALRANAQPQDPAEIFRAAHEAYAQGSYAAAARGFEAAHEQSPSAEAIYNAGRAWAAASDPPRAADAYEAALGMSGLDSKRRAHAEKQLEALQKGLARVSLSGADGARVSVAHIERKALPFVVHLSPGQHRLRAEWEDAKREQVIDVVAGQQLTVELQRPSPSSAPAPKPAPPRPRAQPAVRDNQVDTGTGLETPLGWTLVGAGVVAAGTAVVLGFAALDARDEFNASEHTNRDAHDRAASLRTWTNVAWVAAGVFAAGGATLVILGADSKKQDASDASSLVLAPGQIGWRQRF